MTRLSPDALGDVERLRDFLDQNGPGAAQRALAAIWIAIGKLQEFPELGTATTDIAIRQILVKFGSHGYVVRYTKQEGDDILVTRIWHGLEQRS